MTDRIQHSNHSSHWLIQSGDVGIETAPQHTSNNQQNSSQNYWSYYTDFNIPVWKRALGGALLPVVGPLTLFGVGCEDDARSKIPVEDGGPPHSGVPQDEGPVAKENHPPVWNFIPDQQVVEGAELLLQFAATDHDGDVLDYIPDILPRGAGLTAEGRFNWTPDFDQAGEYDVGVRVRDGSVSVPASFKVIVENGNRPPVMQPIPPKTGEEGTPLTFQVYASDPDGDQLQFSAESLPEGAALGSSTGLFVWTPNYEQAGEYNDVIVKVSDEVNTVAQGVNILVRETNRSPIFEQPLTLQTTSEGEELSFAVVASDPDHDRVELSVDPQTLPQNALFDPRAGEFRWTPSFEDGGKIFKVKFFATDGRATSEHNVSIQVENTNRPPEIIAPVEDQRIEEGQTISFPVEVSDPDDGDMVDVDAQLPPGAVFEDGVFTWTPDYDQAAEAAYEAAFEATDNHLAGTIRSVRIFVENTNRPPSVVVPGRDFTVAEGARLTFAVSGVDPDEGEVAVSISPDSPLPEGARFSEGIFDWTPNYNQAQPEPYEIVLRAADAEGEITEERVRISVENTNRPPHVDPVENQEVAEGATLDFQISASDPDDNPITFIPEELPPGAELTPDARFSWTPNFAQAGNNYRVGFRVSDGQDEVPAGFNIDVENTNRPPVIDPIEAQRVVEDGYLSFFVTASDPDAEEVSVRAASLPSGAVFHEDAGEFEWSPDYDEAGEHQVVFEATDGHDTVSQTVSITVENTNRPPTIIPLPDMTVAEGAQLVFAVGAADLDGGDITLTAAILPEGAMFEEGVFSWIPNYEQAQVEPYRAVFRAADAEGAAADEEVDITVQNTNRAPVFDPIEDQVVSEGEDVHFVVSAHDPDGQPVVLGINRLPDGARFDPETGIFSWVPRFEQSGIHILEFTASDGESIILQRAVLTIKEVDRAPRIDPVPDLMISEGERLLFVVRARDSDGNSLQLDVDGLPEGAHFEPLESIFDWKPNYIQAGEYEIIFRASSQGETTEEIVKINVENTNLMPGFENPAPDQHISCREPVSFVITAREPEGDVVEVAAENLPDGASFDSQSGVFQWTPGQGQVGNYQLVFVARSGNHQAEYTVNIFIEFLELVSKNFEGEIGVDSSFDPSLSADGRFVGFTSATVNFFPPTLYPASHVFVYDRETNITNVVDVNSEGEIAWDYSADLILNSDGRVVSFTSSGENLVAADENWVSDIFVRDLENGITERASISSEGVEANSGSDSSALSADGRFIAFQSWASNLVPADRNILGLNDIFIHDRVTRRTERVNVSSEGVESNDGSFSEEPAISDDGRIVAFSSFASNLVPLDTNEQSDIFVRDRENGITERVSVSSDGTETSWGHSSNPTLSGDGRYVAFDSVGPNLVIPRERELDSDIFVHDRESRVTEWVSIGLEGVEANGGSFRPVITGNGRFVAFLSGATNLVPGDENNKIDVFVHDRLHGLTRRVHIVSHDVEANEGAWDFSISANGAFLSFESDANNLVPGDMNGSSDIFLVSLACFFDLENE